MTHEKYKLKGEQLRRKHIHELILHGDIVDLTKFLLYGYDKTKWQRLGGMYND